MSYIKIAANEISSPIKKFLSEEILNGIVS